MTEKTQNGLTYFLLGAVLFIFCWLAILTGFVVGVCQDVLAITETTPETEAVATTEIETAPVETSIPKVEENMPTETEETTQGTTEATEATEAAEPEIEINARDLELLACVIYQEAGGNAQCDECRRRVADVVLNRVADPRFGNTIASVLTAEGQYGNWSITGVVWPERAKYEWDAVQRAYRIAEEVLRGQHSELYDNGYVWQATFPQGTDNVYCCGQYFGKGKAY